MLSYIYIHIYIYHFVVAIVSTVIMSSTSAHEWFSVVSLTSFDIKCNHYRASRDSDIGDTTFRDIGSSGNITGEVILSTRAENEKTKKTKKKEKKSEEEKRETQ